ncbi:MAG: Gfo/Idh/MocA family oxidoreductase [Clostridia bacterium]|nr:Gfo/Idh/MocA family oxidoreductase [Clostridia bacterium]
MKKIRVGIFGTERGISLGQNFLMNNCEIVAVCDQRSEREQHARNCLGKDFIWYNDFDSFIEHDMDAVVLANYFHEHTPYAIRCFEKGIHVYSECISNGTMAEGVELIRAFEKNDSVIYMLAENYPQMKFNREMKRVCDGGTLGKIVYAEGEYNHPANPYDAPFYKAHVYRADHWRNYIPKSYYVTHSLGPIMRATGATPKKVTSFNCSAPVNRNDPGGCYSAPDIAAIITTLNDDGSVFKFTACSAFGAHSNSYRICGTEGQIENLRGMGEKVMLRYNGWSKPEGMEEVNFYEPEWNDKDEDFIKQSGHGGGDYLTVRHFVDCIKNGCQPEFPFDIYSAVAMSSVAILAHRSMLEGGAPYDIPDFRLEECRKQYENDRLTPCYGENGVVPNIPCCSVTDYKPTEEQIKKYLDLVNS